MAKDKDKVKVSTLRGSLLVRLLDSIRKVNDHRRWVVNDHCPETIR